MDSERWPFRRPQNLATPVILNDSSVASYCEGMYMILIMLLIYILSREISHEFSQSSALLCRVRLSCAGDAIAQTAEPCAPANA